MRKQKKKYPSLIKKTMQRKLNKIAKDTNLFLRRFIAKQKKSNLLVAMKYGLFSGGKKIRSKILIDVGFLFKLDYKTLIVICAAVERFCSFLMVYIVVEMNVFYLRK